VSESKGISSRSYQLLSLVPRSSRDSALRSFGKEMKNYSTLALIVILLVSGLHGQDVVPMKITRILDAVAEFQVDKSLNNLFKDAGLDADKSISQSATLRGGSHEVVTWHLGLEHQWYLRAEFDSSPKFGDGHIIDFKVYYVAEGGNILTLDEVVLQYPFIEARLLNKEKKPNKSEQATPRKPSD